MTKQMLVPGIHFRTGDWTAPQHLFSAYLLPTPETGNPLRTAISHHLLPSTAPLDSTHSPSPLSLLGRHVFKLCPELKEQFHSQLPPLISFRMQKTCYHSSQLPARARPNSLISSFTSSCPGLGNSKSLSLHLLVAALFTSRPSNSAPCFSLCPERPLLSSPAPTSLTPSACPICAKFGKLSHGNLNCQVPGNPALSPSN